MSRSTPRPSAARRVVVPVLLLCASFGLASCSDGDAGPGEAEGPELEGAAARGQQLVRDEGCTACHTADGDDAIGPTWSGLYGSEVTLDDGSTATVDEEYLVRAIEDPNAEVREGFRPIMPERRLAPEDVDAIVAYLREL